MEARLDDLDLLAIQIDGIHMDEDMLLVAAIGVDANGDKHPLGLVEGATESATTVQAVIDNRAWTRSNRATSLHYRWHESAFKRSHTFGRDKRSSAAARFHKGATFWSGCPSMHASVRRVLRQAWEMDDAERAETLIRNLARRLEPDWNGVSASILEGINEMLTVTRLGLPCELRRSLACTNIIENVMGTVRRVCRNVKYWRSPSMALRWAAAAMHEAFKGFRRLKAKKHLPALRAALAKQGQQPPSDEALVQIAEAA